MIFDEIAIEAACDAFRRCEYDTESCVRAALQAALDSLKERGLVREATAALYESGEWYVKENTPWAECTLIPVIIAKVQP